jgi:hypothetical protein
LVLSSKTDIRNVANGHRMKTSSDWVANIVGACVVISAVNRCMNTSLYRVAFIDGANVLIVTVAGWV